MDTRKAQSARRSSSLAFTAMDRREGSGRKWGQETQAPRPVPARKTLRHSDTSPAAAPWSLHVPPGTLWRTAPLSGRDLAGRSARNVPDRLRL